MILVVKTRPVRGFGHTVSWAFLFRVNGIFWPKSRYKVFSFSWILGIRYMIQKFIIHFSRRFIMVPTCEMFDATAPFSSLPPPLTKNRTICNLIPRALMGRSPELFMHYYHLKVRLESQWPLQIKVLRVHYPAGCISKPQRNRAQICTPNVTSLRWVPRRRSRMCENGILRVDNGQWIKE